MWKQLFVLLVCVVSLSLALPVPEVISANVTLTGGPEKGKVKEGNNFVLNCTFQIRYPKNQTNRWKTVTTFWLDGDPLGEYRKMKTTYMDIETRAMHWVTAPKFTKGVNAFPNTAPVDAFGNSYSIVVQPLGKKAKDDYECSVTLENELFTKVRFWSNKLDYSGGLL